MLLAPFGLERSEEHGRMVETNLIGAMTATEVFLEQLRDGGGDILNISSVAGRTAPADFAVYAATTWGMNGWSESLRLELQPNVRVIVIEPGAVATELTDHITHADSKRAAQEATANTHIAPRTSPKSSFAVSRPQLRGAQRETRSSHRPGALTGTCVCLQSSFQRELSAALTAAHEDGRIRSIAAYATAGLLGRASILRGFPAIAALERALAGVSHAGCVRDGRRAGALPR